MTKKEIVDSFKKIYKEIESHKRIIIIRHKNPDYDAYGSQFGLYYALKEHFTNKEFLIDGDDNNNNFYNRLMDKVSDEEYVGSLVILVDQSSLNMLYDERFRLADKLLIVDHHNSEPDFMDFALIVPEYSSASELITEFLITMKINIPKIAADALYIGMAGDSFRFYYKGTTKNTFLMAAKLIECGADILNDYKIMTRDESESFKRLKGYALLNFEMIKRVAFVIINKETIDKFNISDNYASRGVTNLLSGIENCDIWASFVETDNGKVLLEIRSKEIPVINVAKRHGGGGHDLACGATIESMSLKDEILDELTKLVEA